MRKKILKKYFACNVNNLYFFFGNENNFLFVIHLSNKRVIIKFCEHQKKFKIHSQNIFSEKEEKTVCSRKSKTELLLFIIFFSLQKNLAFVLQ